MKSKHMMTAFAVLMLIYQGWRVFDYMGSNLADVSDTVRLVVSVAFLAFSELGLLAWLHIGQPNATTDIQESVAAGMVWTDFAGSMIVGLGDMLKHNTMYAVDLSAVDPLLFLAPWLMVVFNLGAYLLYAQNDSDAKLEREERRLTHEEHGLEMAARRAAIKEIRANKDAIAEKLAPHYFKNIHDRVTGRTLTRFTRAAREIEKRDQLVQPSPSGNGRFVNYNSEAEALPQGQLTAKPESIPQKERKPRA